MSNSYHTEVVSNINFQNNQNYVFPQRESVFKEVYIMEAKFLGLKPKVFIFFLIISFLLTPILPIFFFSSIFMLGYLLFFILFFVLVVILQFLNYATFKSFFHGAYILSFIVYQKFYQDNFVHIYFLGKGIYLIDKGKGKYKKVFYLPERYGFISKEVNVKQQTSQYNYYGN